MTRPAEVLRSVRVVEEVAELSRLPRLWSAKALAAHLCVSRALLFKLFKNGKLKGYRIASCDYKDRQPLRFNEADVMRLIREVKR